MNLNINNTDLTYDFGMHSTIYIILKNIFNAYPTSRDSS